jgi:putative ABC transport system permease protein
MMNRDLGMNIDQVIVLNGPRLTNWNEAYYNNIGSFKSELRQYPAISHVTASRRLPGRRTGRIFNIQRLEGDSQQRFTTSDIGVDHDYFKTFDMKVLAGRGFDSSDHNINFRAIKSVILNESASKLLGFDTPEAAYQKRIRFWGQEWEIVGVVADHHQQSLHVPVEPIIFTPQYSTGNFFFVKASAENLPRTIAAIEKEYQKFFHGNSFSYFFLDEFFNRQYQVDKHFRTAFMLFASLGVLLACLGLFGLSFFTTAQRTKEIGIRKVVGATAANILGLLVKDFSKIILLAAVLASPLTYYVINQWLAGYAYHINVSWTMLVIPGIATLIIALLTVSYQTIKAALLNPVDPLKCE